MRIPLAVAWPPGPNRTLARRATLLVVVVTVVAGPACSTGPGDDPASGSVPAATVAATGGSGTANPYFAAEFVVEDTPRHFGQNPSWTADGRVLTNRVTADGAWQVFRSELDGSDEECLTCDHQGPNAFPLEQPGGDWILFCSWRLREPRFGAPCLGGYGTDLFVMRHDGSDVTALTSPDPAEGDDPVDSYHPAWSPDGRSIVWTHVRFRTVAEGGAEWSIRTATFDAAGPQGPRLVDEHVVVPSGDDAFETHSWAPDGSGFLYTRAGGATSGDGWLNTELYAAWIEGHGATPDRPVLERLTDGSPAWDEQATFTPDGRNVIWMSSRTHPSRYETVVSAAQWTGFDTEQPDNLFGPLFIFAIGDPAFRTELFILDLETRAVRQLTFDDAVVPEFHFDPTGRRLLWGQGGGTRTRVGTFELDRPTGQTTGSPPPGPPTAPVVGTASREGQTIAPEVAEAAVVLNRELQRLHDDLAPAFGGPA